MKKSINFSEFKKKIEKGSGASVYLFLGAEEFTKKEALNLLIQKLISPGLETFDLNYLDPQEVEISEIINIASTFPAGSPTRLLIVKEIKKFELSQRNQLADFLPKIPKTTCLVMLASELSEKEKLYQAISNSGLIVQFGELRKDTLTKWITEQFDTHKKKIDADAIAYLAESEGNDLNSLSKEIEKIAAYVGENEGVTKADIEKVTAGGQRWNVYQLIDQILQKNTSQALNTLEEILLWGEAPSRINYALSDHFMGLLRTKSYPQKDWAGLLEYVGLDPRRSFLVQRYSQQVRNFSSIQLEKAVQLLYQSELNLRSNLSSPKIILEVLVYNLTHL